jgi:hypothetical protein
MRTLLFSAATVALATLSPVPTHADEGGISFWLPGLYGSLAAVPGEPGWSFATVYVHPSVKASAGQEFPRGGRIDLAGR